MNGFVDALIHTLDKLNERLVNAVCFLSLIMTFVIRKLVGKLIKAMCAVGHILDLKIAKIKHAINQFMTLDAIDLFIEAVECPAINEDVVEHVDTTQKKSNRSNTTAGANDSGRSCQMKQKKNQISSSITNVESRKAKLSAEQREFIGKFINGETMSAHKFMTDTSGSNIVSNTPQTNGQGPRTKNAWNPENRRRPVDWSPDWRRDRYASDGTTGSPGTCIERGGHDVTKKRAAAMRPAHPRFPGSTAATPGPYAARDAARLLDFSVPPTAELPAPGPGPYWYGHVDGPSRVGATST